MLFFSIRNIPYHTGQGLFFFYLKIKIGKTIGVGWERLSFISFWRAGLIVHLAKSWWVSGHKSQEGNKRPRVLRDPGPFSPSIGAQWTSTWSTQKSSRQSWVWRGVLVPGQSYVLCSSLQRYLLEWFTVQWCVPCIVHKPYHTGRVCRSSRRVDRRQLLESNPSKRASCEMKRPCQRAQGRQFLHLWTKAGLP